MRKKRNPMSYRPLATIRRIVKKPEVKPEFKGLVQKGQAAKRHAPNPTDIRWVLMEEFVVFKRQYKNASVETARVLRYRMICFYRYLEMRDLYCQNVTIPLAQNFLDILAGQGYLRTTITETKKVLCCFYDWGVEWNKFKMERNPFRFTHTPESAPMRVQSVMSKGKFEVLLVKTKNKDPWDYMAVMGWELGLRISDVALMTWDSVNFEQDYVIVEPRKTRNRTGHRVLAPMSARLKKMLLTMKERSHAYKQDSSPYVCPTLAEIYQKRSSVVSDLFGDVCKRCGLNGVTFKSFRHGFITRMLEAGVPPQIVMSLSGHTHLQTLWKYTHIGMDAKKKALEQANGEKQHWENKEHLDAFVKPLPGT